MKVPTVHLNGTSKQSLLDGYDKAYTAIQDAYQELKQTAPNGRDYYVQEPGALDVAASEHHGRLAMLHHVMTELEQIMGEIDQQGN
jgi:hypothetical protein